MDNDFLFHDGSPAPLRRPNHCNRSCVQFPLCHFPKNCPILRKDKAAQKIEEESGRPVPVR